MYPFRTKVITFKNMTENEEDQILNIKRTQFHFTSNDKVKGWDEYDQDAHHILTQLEESNVVIGYARVCGPNTFLPSPSISRVSTRDDFTSKGIASNVVQLGLTRIKEVYNQPTTIIVRNALIDFYKRLQFEMRPDQVELIKGVYYEMVNTNTSN